MPVWRHPATGVSGPFYFAALPRSGTQGVLAVGPFFDQLDPHVRSAAVAADESPELPLGARGAAPGAGDGGEDGGPKRSLT